METFIVGNIIKGQVTGIEKYGIFMNLENGYSGLIHISEISEGFVKDINDFAQIGDTIFCKILEINEENKNTKLSIKNINYKMDNGNGKFTETVRGFSPLKDQLDNWINIKLEEIEEENKKTSI